MRARPVLSAINNAPRPVAPRFWSRVDRRGPEECWLWRGSITSWGYGSVRIGDRAYIASRVAWTLANNDEPGELLVCHSCDNPACVNPAHLWLGTDGDNHRDMMAKGRHHANGVKGERHMWTKLTEAQVRYVKSSDKPGTVLAAELNVCQTTISEIRQGRNWAWLEVANETRPRSRTEIADENAAKVAAMYLAGRTAREIAKEMGFPFYNNVYPLLRRAGVTYRHKPEANNRRNTPSELRYATPACASSDTFRAVP